MNRMKYLFTCLCILALTVSSYSQEVIRLYAGKARGSETWAWKEQNVVSVIRDVLDPTITVFRPDTPNGITNK